MNSQILFQANPDPLFAVDFQGCFLVANPACSMVSGYSLPELLRLSFPDICAPDQLQSTLAAFKTALQDRQHSDIETALITKDGRRVELWIAGQFITLIGNTPALFCAARDVTQRRLTEQALFESEQRLKLALECGGMGSWDWDVVTDCATWTPGLTALLGYGPGNAPLSQERFRARVHPEDRPRQEGEMEQSMRQRRDYRCEFRVVWPNGEIHWVEARGHYHYDENNAPRRMYGVLIAIDERKAAEAALHESEARFRTMADGAPIIIWVTDPAGRQLFVNHAYREFFDVSFEAALQNGWKCLVHPDDTAYVNDFNRALRERSSFHGEARALSHNSWRWIQSDARPRISPTGEFLGMVGCSMDITARRMFQAELELQVQDRTQALSGLVDQLNDFCYSIAHDLKAPIRAQLAYATILLTDYGDTLAPEALRCAERIESSARRQSALVTDLLKYMSLTRSDVPFEPIDLKQALAAVLLDFDPEIRTRDALLEVDVSGSVLAVPESLRLVLANLIDNALKFVPQERRPSIHIFSEVTSEGARVTVTDNGLGIPPGAESKLFNLFQRFHNSPHYPGTGVGLAIVKKAVERMGGQVGYQAQPGGGSAFWILLRNA